MKNTHTQSKATAVRTSILERVITQSISVTVITTVILSCAAYWMTNNLIEQRVYSQLSALVSAKEELIAWRIDADRKRTAIMSSRAQVIAIGKGRGSKAEVSALLESIQEEGIPALGISVFDVRGKTVAQAGMTMEYKDTDATILVPSKGIEGWDGYTIYSPIADSGVLAIHYSIREFLQGILTVPSLGDTGEVLLAKEEQGQLLLLNNAYAPGKRSPLSLGIFSDRLADGLPTAQAVAKQEGMRAGTDYRGNAVFTAFRQLPVLGWGLVVNVHRAEAMNGVIRMALTLAIVSMLLLVFAGYLATHLARRLTAPLLQLTEKMRHLGPKHWSMGRTIHTGDEVEVLEHIASDMAGRLKKIYDHLEEAIEERTKELAAQYLKDRTILESVDSAVILINPQGIITNANPAAHTILLCKNTCINMKYAEALDIRLHQKKLLGTKHPVRQVLSKKTEIRSTPDTYYSIMRSDNILVPIWMVIKPLMEGKKCIGAIAVMNDITEERRVDYLKSEFISLASHQLRTPLSSLQWYIEILNDEKQLSPDQQDYVNEMSIAARRMSDLIDALLHAARLEGGNITPHKNAVQMNSLIMDLTEELRSSAKQKQISMTVNVPKTKVEMLTDSVLLHVVFKNLFSNAVKYTNSGGKIMVVMTASTQHVEITVKDNGIGIPKKDQKRLFERLFRADNVRKLDTDGNGLGLYISKMIVESLGGSIKAVSTANKGTSIIVKLPISQKMKKK